MTWLPPSLPPATDAALPPPLPAPDAPPACLPPIFVITLPEEPWKESASRAEFAAQGIEPFYIHGYHGMLLGLRPTNPFQFERNGSAEYIHVNQVGCALSHLTMLKAAVATGAPEFICCEDDVVPGPDFARRWLEVRATLPASIDVVQIEYKAVQQFIKQENGEHAWTDMPTTPLAPGLVRCPGYGHCTACIWWRRDTAIGAVQRLRPVDAPFDIMLMRKVYPFCHHALCDPHLASQRTAYGGWPSSIGDAAGKYLNVDKRSAILTD